MTPEQLARQKIDAQLTACGWFVQDYKAMDFSVGRGIALREVPLKTGPCDYLLLVDRKPVGVVEAKKEGTTLSTVAEQSGRYASSLPDFLTSGLTGPLPFLYETTGVETFFRDERDPEPRSRAVFSFHRPETLGEWLAESGTLRKRLQLLPPLPKQGMRGCQVEGITELEKSFKENHPRALIQMATGAGKTFTACAFTYRLIKYAGARRVLFLVDRSNLGRQATAEFQQFVTPDTGRKFTELYNVQHLTSNALDPVCRVTICTIQRLYSMLRGEELPEDADEMSTYEIGAADGRPKEVAYNPAIPIEMFDFVVTDECHRSIYNLWRQVLEYFDAFLIGLTATPSKQTIGFFNQNLVTEYNHERAVADGVNVGYEVYRIKTQVTEQGGKVEKGFYVDKRNKLDRSKRWEQLDEDLTYTAPELDRSVVVPSQIRTVLQAFKDALFTELFPGRTLVPKTLIFAKNDSHAEDIAHICREVFGKGNDFAKKITYNSYNLETKRYEKSEALIQEFRTSPQLRIAVTVDMIATGTDIKPLECLLFLRDVRSRVYFEQMKGRGTRVLTPTDLQAVSGADARVKTHFIIVDAVGVCESDKTDSRPLEKQPSVKFDKLLLGVALGKRDEDTLTTLAGRLARLDRELDPAQRSQVTEITGGKSVAQMSATLLRAIDPDEVEAASRRLLIQREHDRELELAKFLNPLAPIEFHSANLPHWRQEGVTYFVTFRLADSLPQEKLDQWHGEREIWLKLHPLPLSADDQAEYHERFSARMEQWLDQGSGSCVLALPECRVIVENALRHFNGERYTLGEFVVAPNHVHAIVAPKPGHELSDILHSWKSFTSKEMIKVEAARERLQPFWESRAVEAAERRLAGSGDVEVASRRLGVSGDVEVASRRLGGAAGEVGGMKKGSGETPLPRTEGDGGSGETPLLRTEDAGSGGTPLLRGNFKYPGGVVLARVVWQKESYDHIIRDSEAMARIERYIREHGTYDGVKKLDWEGLRRDAAATLIAEACAPFDKPVLRDTLVKLKQENEQTIDTVTADVVTLQGFDAAAKEKAANLLRSFRDYIEQHKAEITALQILYSRPYKQRLTEPMLKELEKKLRENHAAWTEDRLWDAFAATAPSKVKGRSQAGRFADLVALVRFALEQQPVLAPFADSVSERFDEWLSKRGGAPVGGGKGERRDGGDAFGGGEGLGKGERRDAAATVEAATVAVTVFNAEQLVWLGLIRDHIATSLSIEPDDFDYAPFSQRGGLGKAHQLFGEQLPKLLDELNEVLAA